MQTFEADVPLCDEMKIHALVDEFAKRVNATSMTVIDWVEALEGRLGHRFPLSFHSFLSHYEFPPFEWQGILFFANTRLAAEEREELRLAIFQDKVLSQCLLANGYIQIGRPDSGDYDPICFDTNTKRSNREYPLVCIDHESILCFNKIRVLRNLAPSFHHFISG